MFQSESKCEAFHMVILFTRKFWFIWTCFETEAKDNLPILKSFLFLDFEREGSAFIIIIFIIIFIIIIILFLGTIQRMTDCTKLGLWYFYGIFLTVS